MPKNLIWKELRETAWIAAAALVVYAFLVAPLMQYPVPFFLGYLSLASEAYTEAIPFVTDSFLFLFMMISMCFAVALGFRQSLIESGRGTYPFLLQRPASRKRLIGTKLLVGAGLYLGCAALPILVYACWAAKPGTHASPFHWSMTLGAWEAWLSIGVLYLGAFLSGIRPGRWIGTRLLPLLAAGGLTGFFAVPPWWLITGVPALLLMMVLLVVEIFYVAETRDFS